MYLAPTGEKTSEKSIENELDTIRRLSTSSFEIRLHTTSRV